ncbi:cycle-inhibiting factor [Serratia sp. M24T3]|uniref:cycle-inhibiting factor n=1 Tax=Serratia sp. M24T3 TaxID=932213 RepID=UPI00025BB23E|nr:cycle-inhibiting factor [Serratia sp. M24T3]EIC83191.1 hypothetical protein SPM24T3_18156 [Serratia sp. M24T3]
MQAYENNKMAHPQKKQKADAISTASPSYTSDRHTRIDKILALHQSKVGNRLLWNDEWEKHINSRNHAEMINILSGVIEAFGGLESYIEITTIDPFVLTDPVCGLSAQNIFKLMVENDHSVNPVDTIKKDPSNTDALEKMTEDKSYVVLVNDARLGHMFLIDKPAGSDVGYIYQSNLGGSLPALSIADWMKTRSKDPVSIALIKRYLHKDSLKTNSSQWKKDVASMLEINNDSEKIDMTQLKEEKDVIFHVRQYDDFVFNKNLTLLSMQG